MNVVGSDSTESRRAAAGSASMSISSGSPPGRSVHTSSTTRRTAAQGPHHSALKCTTVGPVRDRPRSAVSSHGDSARLRSTRPSGDHQHADQGGHAERDHDHAQHRDQRRRHVWAELIQAQC